jgi:hypothetical protein
MAARVRYRDEVLSQAFKVKGLSGRLPRFPSNLHHRLQTREHPVLEKCCRSETAKGQYHRPNQRLLRERAEGAIP